MKLLMAMALTCTITVQTHATDLSQHIANSNPSLAISTVHAVAGELKKYPRIMTHIAKKESNFNPKAHSKGCVGLTGVNVKVWAKTLIEEKIIKHPRDLWSIKHNLKAGFYIYKHYGKSYRKFRRGH